MSNIQRVPLHWDFTSKSLIHTLLLLPELSIVDSISISNIFEMACCVINSITIELGCTHTPYGCSVVTSLASVS